MTSFSDIASIIPRLVLDLLMGHSLKSISLGIICPIAGLMDEKHEQHGCDDHCGLFIYLNLEYLKSYYDVRIFHQSDIHKSWY